MKEKWECCKKRCCAFDKVVCSFVPYYVLALLRNLEEIGGNGVMGYCEGCLRFEGLRM